MGDNIAQSNHKNNAVINEVCDPSPPQSRSTQWRRAKGKPSLTDKATSQRYLTPHEEDAAEQHALRMYERGYPLTIERLRSIAFILALQRGSPFQALPTDTALKPPGKNWVQALLKRRNRLKAIRAKALDWNRHDHNIYDKTVQWFTIIGRELHDPAILPENVYNTDETGVRLAALSSLTVLVDGDNPKSYRGTGVNREMVTSIECICMDGTYLNPMFVWPTSTHRSSWTVHARPGWHFACSKSGYINTAISLAWMQKVFDPSTRAKAQGRPRILISDGFGSHESLPLMKFCHENRIILCRLPSHTSHITQPCDRSVFGPLKGGYRKRVEKSYRGGANTVSKSHFLLFYGEARIEAFTRRNIEAGWAKTGLYPFNPARVLNEMQKPPSEPVPLPPTQSATCSAQVDAPLTTPVTAESLAYLRQKIEKAVDVNDPVRHDLQKMANATEKAFADRNILLDENRILFEQNNEKNTRQSARSRMVGQAKVMSYEDIQEAERRLELKENERGAKRRGKKIQNLLHGDMRDEFAKGMKEIKNWGLEGYCNVLHFSA